MAKYLWGTDQDPNYDRKAIKLMLKHGFDQSQLKPFELIEMKEELEKLKQKKKADKEKGDEVSSDTD